MISVVIPTYNRCRSLRVTLEGLARQDFPADQFEAVVVSDGCTDGTDAELTALAKSKVYPFVLRPVFQANAGPARARNRGIEEAHGDIIVFLDDDVEPALNFLSCHARHHAQSSQIAVIGPMSPDPVRRWQEPCWIAWEHAMLEKQYANWRTGVWNGVGPHNFYTGNASVARHHILSVGGFDETFKRQEDVEMATRMSRCDPPVCFAFEGEAIGTHRPQRTFDSWRAVPTAYGKLDVVRFQRGDIEWSSIWSAYHDRNRVTQFCMHLCLTAPAVAAPLETALSALSNGLWRLRLPGPALTALSVVYNIRYLLGVNEGLGEGTHSLRQRLAKPAASAPSSPGVSSARTAK